MEGRELDPDLLRRFAEACAEAYGFSDLGKRQIVAEIEGAYLAGRAGPDWDSLDERAGRTLTDADLEARGLTPEEIREVRGSV